MTGDGKNDDEHPDNTENTVVRSNDDDDDDDEDDDDDYNPDDDKEDEEDNNNNGTIGDLMNNKNQIPICSLSESKIRAVDEAFESLFGYKYGTHFYQPRIRRRRRRSPSPPPREEEEVMEALFGPIAAARLVATRHYVTTKQQPNTDITSVEEETIVTTELKQYAGNIISVPATKKKQKKRKLESGMNQLLQELDDGPSKLTTVAKTSSDWDSFKTQTGVEEELEAKAQGKEAYLQRQDFLTRVDRRKFVGEKQEREDERRKRGK